MDYILGETNEVLSIDTAEENRNIVNALAGQARQSIYIFTQDLDAALYDNETFEDHIFNFASNARNAEIRILIQDVTRAIQSSHRLIRLAQKLSSFIHIRKPCEEFKSEQGAFMTVDNAGYLYRIKGDRYNYRAEANFKSPLRTGELNNFFTEIWEQSDPDPRTRSFII